MIVEDIKEPFTNMDTKDFDFSSMVTIKVD